MNRVDEYYQQQEEMLEGFMKMDDLTDEDTSEYGSKVRCDLHLPFELLVRFLPSVVSFLQDFKCVGHILMICMKKPFLLDIAPCVSTLSWNLTFISRDEE
jgi:hypothetical protein